MFNLIADIDFLVVVRQTLFFINVLQRELLPVQMRMETVRSYNVKSIDDMSLLQSLLLTNK